MPSFVGPTHNLGSIEVTGAVDYGGSTNQAISLITKGYVDAKSGWMIPTGWKYMSNGRANLAGVLTPTSGTSYVAGLWLPAGTSVSKLGIHTSAASSTLTHHWMALWDVNRVVRAVSADIGTGSLMTNAINSYTVSGSYPGTTPYVIPTAGFYYCEFLYAGTGAPVLTGVTVDTGLCMATAPAIMGLGATGQTAPPALGATRNALTNPSSGGTAPMAWFLVG